MDSKLIVGVVFVVQTFAGRLKPHCYNIIPTCVTDYDRSRLHKHEKLIKYWKCYPLMTEELWTPIEHLCPSNRWFCKTLQDCIVISD